MILKWEKSSVSNLYKNRGDWDLRYNGSLQGWVRPDEDEWRWVILRSAMETQSGNAQTKEAAMIAVELLLK